MAHQFFVYILANKKRTIYIGFTNDLRRRVYEHKTKRIAGFTRKYDVTRLVYYEAYSEVNDARARERQLKAWRRAKKDALVIGMNPKWADLAADWFEAE